MILWLQICSFIFSPCSITLQHCAVCLSDSTRSVIGWRASLTRLTWTYSLLHWTPTSTVFPRGPRYFRPLAFYQNRDQNISANVLNPHSQSSWDEPMTMPLLMWLMCACVSGAARAANGLGEAVYVTEQHNELPGALQHSATGQQPDQVRCLHQLIETQGWSILRTSASLA